jgi:hypothetical protein
MHLLNGSTRSYIHDVQGAGRLWLLMNGLHSARRSQVPIPCFIIGKARLSHPVFCNRRSLVPLFRIFGLNLFEERRRRKNKKQKKKPWRKEKGKKRN